MHCVSTVTVTKTVFPDAILAVCRIRPAARGGKKSAFRAIKIKIFAFMKNMPV